MDIHCAVLGKDELRADGFQVSKYFSFGYSLRKLGLRETRGGSISVYDQLKRYFNFLNTGYKDNTSEIFAYNGGLFKPDDVLDSVKISDDVLKQHISKLADYDFSSEVDVNILGRIFENSLTEIDEIKAKLNGDKLDKSQSKRKKDGVFYTPKYITNYIVQNTIGKLCSDKKAEIGILDANYIMDKKRQKKTQEVLLQKLKDYREWLLAITICDPACGSGAFLNEALNFLMAEHAYLDELESKLFGGGLVFQEVRNHILENNLFGVDINQESVEIAKLSLWLRTAEPHRKLSNLNENLKCGNSLIDNASVAGDKAFVWREEFPDVFNNGGFDVVIGNPPYVQVYDTSIKNEYVNKFNSFKRNFDLYSAFYEQAINLIKENGKLGFITPNTFIKGEYFIELREYLNQYQIIEIIDFGNKLVFEDANVFSAITILDKKISANDWILKSNLAEIKGIVKKNSVNFNIENIISEKFSKFKTIDDIFLVKDVGINYWTIGRGKVRGESIGSRVLYKGIKQSINDIPYIKGSNFNKYTDVHLENYLRHNYQDFLNENDVFRFSDSLLKTTPKLIYRQTSSELIATVDVNGHLTDKTVHIIVNRNNFSENLYFLLVLFNSSLYQYLYTSATNEEGRAFAQVKTINVKKLPYIQIEESLQKPFVEKSDEMLILNKKLKDIFEKFLRTLERRFNLSRPSKILQNWQNISYKEFTKELAKNKIKLSLADEAEWEDYFLTEKTKAQFLQAQIIQTDKEIDDMVYQLYGLTDDEIKIIESH